MFKSLRVKRPNHGVQRCHESRLTRVLALPVSAIPAEEGGLLAPQPGNALDYFFHRGSSYLSFVSSSFLARRLRRVLRGFEFQSQRTPDKHKHRNAHQHGPLVAVEEIAGLSE
jgi:hypothetical protein